MPGKNWFQQNAPTGGNWFQQNAPDASPAPEDNPPPVPKAPIPAGLTGPSSPNIAGGVLKAGKTLGDLYTGASKGLVHTMYDIGAPAGWAAEKMGIVPKMTPEEREQQESIFKPSNTAQAIGHGAEQIGEFMVPGGAEERAAGKIAELAPKLGKVLPRIGTAALSSGLVNKAQGGDFGAGAAAGGIGAGASAGLRAVAPGIAEAALKVRGNQRLFGRTVGDAILNDTRGVRPETIGRTAQETIQKLSPEIAAADQASAASGARGSLLPARQGVAQDIGRHATNRAMGTADEIRPVQDFLHTDQLTKQPLAVNQTAAGLRALKRGLNSDFISSWKPDESIEKKQAARKAYGLINRELHTISPETASLDQRESSLIPVVQQGRRVASGAPLSQRVLGRVGAHTGALTLGGIGAYEGKREGGLPGMVAGGLTGVLAPEIIASPEGQMAIARSLNAVRGLKPAVGAGLQLERRKGQQ